MTQKRSSCNLNLDANLLLFTIKKNLGFSAVFSVLVFLFSPLYIYKYLTDKAKYFSTVNTKDLFVIFAVSMSVAATVFFLILLYINFSFLYKKSTSDMYHSMPLKRSELLITRFLASYVSALIPLTVGFLGFNAALGFAGVAVNFVFYLKIYALIAALLLFCGLFSLIFVISAGTLFDSVVAFISVNIGVIIMVAIVNTVMERNIVGLRENNTFIHNLLYSTAMNSTPFGVSLNILATSLIENKIVFSLGQIIAVTVFSAIMLLLNIFLYNKRKSEKCKTNFAFKFMPVIIGFIASFIGYFFFNLIFGSSVNNCFSIFGIIGAFVFGIIYNIITSRGFKQIKKALVVSAATYLSVLLIFASIQVDIFGVEKYVPDVNNIEDVNVWVAGYKFYASNKDAVVSMHKEIINSGFKMDENNSSYVEICYNLKNGRSVSRSYTVLNNTAKTEKLLFLHNDIPNNIQQKFKAKSEIKTFECNMYYTNDIKAGTEESRFATLPRNYAEGLLNALISDYENIKDINDVYGTKIYTVYLNAAPKNKKELSESANAVYNEGFNVYGSFKNTLKYLEKIKASKYMVTEEAAG